MERMVPVDGGAVWADDSGGDGPPVVLVHPGVGDADFWLPVLPGLTARYRVIRFDSRGYGRSPQPTGPYSAVADLLAVLDEFGLDRVSGVGCSQGGGNLLNLAVEHPDRLDRLVLLCPGAAGWQPEADPELAARWAALRDAGDVDGSLAVALSLWGRAGRTDAVVAQLRSAIGGYAGQDRFEQPETPVLDRLTEVTAPTVLLVGDADWPPLIALNHRLAAGIPGCALVPAPGVDHFPTLRAPGLVLDTITGHLG
jgi:3-oxoadipate enol-lactonase